MSLSGMSSVKDLCTMELNNSLTLTLSTRTAIFFKTRKGSPILVESFRSWTIKNGSQVWPRVGGTFGCHLHLSQPTPSSMKVCSSPGPCPPVQGTRQDGPGVYTLPTYPRPDPTESPGSIRTGLRKGWIGIVFSMSVNSISLVTS